MEYGKEKDMQYWIGDKMEMMLKKLDNEEGVKYAIDRQTDRQTDRHELLI